MTGETGKIPLVVRTDGVVDIGHSAEKAAESVMGIAAEEVGLAEQVVVLLFRNVAALVDVLDGDVALSDHTETAGADRLVVRTGLVEGQLLDDVLVQVALLEVQLGDAEGAAVRRIGRTLPAETVVLEQVVVEGEHVMDRLLVLATVGVIRVREVIPEIVIGGKNLLVGKSQLRIHVQIVAGCRAYRAEDQCEQILYNSLLHIPIRLKINFDSQFDNPHDRIGQSAGTHGHRFDLRDGSER